MSTLYSEAALERKLVNNVKSVGGWAIKFVPSFIAGLPDRICLFPGGLIIFVEMKAPGKKPDAVQRAVHARLRALGFRVEVLDSAEGVTKFIKDVTC